MTQDVDATSRKGTHLLQSQETSATVYLQKKTVHVTNILVITKVNVRKRTQELINSSEVDILIKHKELGHDTVTHVMSHEREKKKRFDTRIFV